MAEELEELVARWRADEKRLYPMIMVQPDRYERYLVVVRAVADELRALRSPEELGRAYRNSGATISAIVAREATSARDLDLGLVTSAAFSLRYSEILGEMYRFEAMDRVRAARSAGNEWVTVYQTGTADDWRQRRYEALEMHLPDGIALNLSVEIDAETYGPVYGIEVVQLDPQTGDWLNDVAPLVDQRTWTEPGPWQEAVEEYKRLYSGRRS
jgi:hypothetical protein